MNKEIDPSLSKDNKGKRKLFKRDWHLQILGSAIISLIIALFFFQLGIKKRVPIFVVDPIRTEIVSSTHISEIPLRIQRLDGKEIKSDLTSITFYFWNKGRKPIKKYDILGKLKLMIDDPQANILDYRIIGQSREAINFVLYHDSDNPKVHVNMDFTILEHNDGITGQIVYEGNPKASFNLLGDIEDVKEIKKRAVSTGYFVKTSIIYFFLWTFVIIAFLVLAARRSLYSKAKYEGQSEENLLEIQWLSTKVLKERLTFGRLKKQDWLAIAVIFGIVIFLTLSTLHSVYSQTEKNPSSYIPSEILPSE